MKMFRLSQFFPVSAPAGADGGDAGGSGGPDTGGAGDAGSQGDDNGDTGGDTGGGEGGSGDTDSGTGGDDGGDGSDGDDAGGSGSGDDGDGADSEEGGETGEISMENIKVPEGFSLSDTQLDGVKGLLTELGVEGNSDFAQKVVDFGAKHLSEVATAQESAYADVVKGWESSAKEDPEYGGRAFEKNLSIAQDAMEKFGTPELTKMLTDSQYGSHPEMIRLFFKLGNMTKEDQPGRSGTGGSEPDDSVEGIANRLYKS